MSALRVSMAILTFFLTSNMVFAEDWTWSDFKREASSPLRDPAKPVTIWGGAAALTVTVFEDQLADGIEEDTYEDRPLGDFSVVGDMAGQLIPNVLYAGGMALHNYYYGDADSRRRAISMTKGSAYAVALSSILKYTIRQPRPNGDNRHSFPSGHTTSASAFAAVVVCEHGWGFAGVSATILATLSGYSRLNDNQHYFHDVLAGAVIGTTYGIGIASLNKGSSTQTSASKSTFIPILGEGKYGIAWFRPF